jgi:tetratricopeptide (TPR) repeat protein
MSDPTSMRDRYLALIDEIVQTTLKGQIRSKEQVYQRLLQDVTPGTGEIFERCLAERIDTTQHQKDTQTDDLKQAKAMRSLRALQTIQGEWERVQKQTQVSSALTAALQSLTAAQRRDRLTALLRVIDPNRTPALTLDQLQQLAKALQQQPSSDPDLDKDLQQLAAGLISGLQSWQRLQDHLISWIYDQNRGPLGFEGAPGQRGPWAVWAAQVNSPIPQALFHTLALNQSLVEWVAQQRHLTLSAWVELALVMQCLQRGLVSWFDKQAYDTKAGAKLSISTFLTFAAIWSELANGFKAAASSTSSEYDRLGDGCFQIALQIFRSFTQRDYFPLYGGIFASFSGDYLRSALSYLDEPLRRVEGTQEKARILTLLGYSLRALGQLEQAKNFHQQALEIAREAGDRSCEIANLNHLSRACVAQKDYETAISYSQRALILSRQSGERLGEANALANLGYSEVFQAQQLEQSEPEVYETAIHYLQQGLQLSERLGDRQSQALCCSSLGIAHLVLSQPEAAIPYLESGLQAAQFSGDLYLQGLNLASLAEAYYGRQNIEKAIYTASLGMYLLEQIASPQWRQAAGLLTILQGQMGAEAFQTLLKRYRSQIIKVIGVDGYDYIPQLLEQYQRSMS